VRQADIESLARLANVHNVLIATNPATASLLIRAIGDALKVGGCLGGSLASGSAWWKRAAAAVSLSVRTDA
jgi:xanthine dehydrogenase iron-sulfur cluster and FAD-binding subunit A